MKFAFVFAGQGAQNVGMGKDIVQTSASARKIFDAGDNVLGWKVSELCFNGPEDKLMQSRFCQPAIYTVSCAFLAAFKDAFPDLKPVASAGLSLGEFAALYSAGVFSFEEGLKLVAKRGELMDEACQENRGMMASVLGADLSLVADICSECGVDVANVNCPGQIVISGQDTKISNAISKLKALGVKKIIPLKVAGAYHSRLMYGAAAKFAVTLADTAFNEPRFPVVQNVSGECVRSVSQIKENLARQVAGSVLWEKCVRSLCGLGAEGLIEFGPGNVLSGLAARINQNLKTFAVNSSKSIEEFKGVWA